MHTSEFPADPSRRALLGAAWSVPLVLVAIAAPAAAATPPPGPELIFSAFRSSGNNFISVGTNNAGVGVATPFAIQAQFPNNGWTNIVNSQTTDSSGGYSGSLPDGFIEGYKAIRILANFSGYGIVLSQAIAVPLP